MGPCASIRTLGCKQLNRGAGYLKQERNILEGLMGAWRAGLGNGLELRQVGDQVPVQEPSSQEDTALAL